MSNVTGLWSRMLVTALSAATVGALAAAPSAADSLVEPLTDEEWAAHVKLVDERVAEAMDEGLATDVTYTVNGDGQTWLPDRVAQQEKIADELYRRGEQVPEEGEALFTGGLPGAGKTTALNQNQDIDASQYLVLNSDDAKEKLCEAGMIPEVEGIAPMEAADLIQRESSRIAEMVAERAAAERKNVIWDTTMGSVASVDGKLATLKDAGYQQYSALFLDVPIEVSLERVDQRHREGYEKFRNGDTCEGRHVPERIIKAQIDREYSSANRRVFEERKTEFDRWYLYDATDMPAVLVSQNS
ncbi:hypothetical protein BLA60_37365 [Actinophytocola xinjiangensis]|uniref:UDP-N-acetylglucosamine kinase n=1 Tax=Actinophytocola xinjiangensis TaxID=485602 RepID=A0A7Z0WE19_9PSEU|nr:zeta toxin family protein [Actinophytocola xinjiangensis]OLF05188.1 hypothetical protein BLA60_37365 [Actinophytocola xinjiangensis]